MTHIDYGALMQGAMQGLIRDLLRMVARDGLPADHHFFITFDTQHPKAQLADWLLDRYPNDLTVVMQHWFDNLEVEETGFSVTLNFGDRPEPLYIPFDAIKTFVDPSVEFGLRLLQPDEEDDEQEFGEEAPHIDVDAEDDGPHEAEVVSLDSFRKS